MKRNSTSSEGIVAKHLWTPFTPFVRCFTAWGAAANLIAMFALYIVGLMAIVVASASLVLMFPTIYGVALQGLGGDATFGAAGLVMAILGGAPAPMVHGPVMDQLGSVMGNIVPSICLASVGAYALFDLTHERPALLADSEGAKK